MVEVFFSGEGQARFRFCGGRKKKAPPEGEAFWQCVFIAKD